MENWYTRTLARRNNATISKTIKIICLTRSHSYMFISRVNESRDCDSGGRMANVISLRQAFQNLRFVPYTCPSNPQQRKEKRGHCYGFVENNQLISRQASSNRISRYSLL